MMMCRESFVTLILNLMDMSEKILAIDPGSQILGWALIHTDPLTYCNSGSLKIPKVDFYDRLGFILSFLENLFAKENPSVLVLEKAFVGINKEAALKLGQVRGAVMAFGQLHKLHFAEYAPRQAKKTVAGYGAASKEQVFSVCKMTLKNMPETIDTFDQSDAVSIALCHHFMLKTHQVWSK